MYYRLSLTTRQKPPRKINVQYGDYNLEKLNWILNVILKNARVIKSQKCKDPVKILKLLDEVVPKDYFGTTHHRKLFYAVVNKILTQSSGECIYSSVIAKGYDYNSILWLGEIKNEKICQHLMKKCNLFVLECVVKPLIAFYYKPVKTMEGHQIQFVRREKWNSFESRAFHKLTKSNYLLHNEDCLKRGARGLLKIIPKGGYEECNFRPLIGVYRDNKRSLYKVITSKVYQAAREMNAHFCESLYDGWTGFLERAGKERVFGVKLDIRDAYGSVDVEVLCKLVSGLPRRCLSDGNKEFVISRVKNQFVTFRKRVYQWKHGLLQGDRLSSCLCELYMTYLDKIFLDKVDLDCFMHRTVDDYFFCSTEAYKVDRFIKLIKSIHQVNDNKTRTNIGENRDEEIPYCGKLFNLATRQVKTLYKFSDKYEIRHRFKLWNCHKPIREQDWRVFLSRPLSFCFSNNSFTKLELNTVFNSQKTVLENFFDGMVYVGFKFDAAVMAVRSVGEDLSLVGTILEKVVLEYAKQVCRKIRKYRGRYYRKDVTVRLLRILAYKAFVLVFKKRNEVYKDLICQIQYMNKLKLHFCQCNVDCAYFRELPKCFRVVKINRKAVV